MDRNISAEQIRAYRLSSALNAGVCCRININFLIVLPLAKVCQK